MPLDHALADLFDMGPSPREVVAPPSEKQVAFAQALAKRHGVAVPKATLGNRRALSRWIDAHRGERSSGPSAKQVAFAERIARIKRREIPQECFRDRGLMSRWIDGNKPR